MDREATEAVRELFGTTCNRFNLSYLTALMVHEELTAILPYLPDYAHANLARQMDMMGGQVGEKEFLELVRYGRSTIWVTNVDIMEACQREIQRQRCLPASPSRLGAGGTALELVPSTSLAQDLQKELASREDFIRMQRQKIDELNAKLQWVQHGGEVPVAEQKASVQAQDNAPLAAGVSSDLPPQSHQLQQRSYKERLTTFYKKYNPEKLATIDQALEAFKGKEEEMFVTLVKKYGAEPPAPGPEGFQPSATQKYDKNNKLKDTTTKGQGSSSSASLAEVYGSKEALNAVLYLEHRCQRAENQLQQTVSKLALLGDYTGRNAPMLHNARALAQDMRQYEDLVFKHPGTIPPSSRANKEPNVPTTSASAGNHHHQYPLSTFSSLGEKPILYATGLPPSPQTFLSPTPRQQPQQHNPQMMLMSPPYEQGGQLDSNKYPTSSYPSQTTPGRGGHQFQQQNHVSSPVYYASSPPPVGTTTPMRFSMQQSNSRTDTLLPTMCLLHSDQTKAFITGVEDGRQRYPPTGSSFSSPQQSPPPAQQTFYASERMNGVYHLLDLEKKRTANACNY